MENEGITGIVAVEKEIQERIERESIRAEEWLKEIREKAEKDLVRAEEEIRKTYDQRLTAFEEEVRSEASKIIERAMRWCKRVNDLRDEELRKVLVRFIVRIIPS